MKGGVVILLMCLRYTIALLALYEAEYETLHTIYTETNGEQWKWADEEYAWNFTDGSDPCIDNWEGITCSSDNSTVLKLRLYNSNAQGTVPSDISVLSSLEVLNLSINHLTGTIPSAIGLLTNLVELILRYSFFTGPIPSNFGSLNKLTTLILSENYLTGAVPTSFDNLSLLYEFDIHDNFFTGAFPQQITENMPELIEFHIDRNIFSGPAPSFVANSFVDRISLFENQFSDLVPSGMFQYNSISYLEISRNLFTGPLPQDMYQCTSLIVLSVHQNFLSSTVSSHIRNMTGLMSFMIYDNLLSGEIPQAAFDLVDLQLIMAHFNRFSGTLPLVISNQKYLSVASNFYSGPLPTLISPFFFIASDNYFTGTLAPSLFGSQLAILELSSNFLTGTIPSIVTQCEQLNHLQLTGNYLTGTIPPEIFELSKLGVLTLAHNELSGTLPPFPRYCTVQTLVCNDNMLHGEINNITSTWLENANLNSNMFTGSVPIDLEWLNIHFLSLSDNFLGGSIPAVYYEAYQLDFIDFSNNLLTGTLPFGLDFSEYLRSFNVHANLLMGTIPKQYNDAVVAIVLSENRFTGYLPADIASKSHLSVFKVQGNQLSGKTVPIFSAAQVELLSVDLSDNRFTGPLPSIIFELPKIQSVAMVKNCFDGKLPPTICDSTTLQVIALDGLASGCKRHLWDPLSIFGDSYITDDTFGSIPACVWDMPALTTLHLSGNGLTGNIESASLKPMSKLTSLSLSHNRLTGTIPGSFKEYLLNFEEFDVSHNRLSGLFDRDNSNMTLYVHNAHIALEVNRFSGYLSNIFSAFDRVRVLNGNIFQCTSRNELPEKDPDANVYICGSGELDSSLWLFLVGFAGFVACVLFCVWKGTQLTVQKQPIGVYAFCRYCYELMLDPSRYLVKMLEEWRGIPIDVVGHCRYVSSVSASDILSVLHAFPAEIVDIKLFSSTIEHLQNISRMVLLFILTTVLPCIVALKLGTDDAARTQSYQYRWFISAAYMSGSTAAIVLCILWFFVVLLCCHFIYMRYLLVKNALISSTQYSSRSMSNISNGCGNVTFFNTLDIIGIILLNMVVVFIVNGAYIYIQLKDVSQAVQIFSQVSLAGFKLVWDTFAVGAAISWISSRRKDNLDDRTLLYTALLVFNNIIAPCFVTAVTDDTCFKSLFEEADAITVEYINTECFSYAIDTNSLVPYCARYSDVAFETSYIPPFNYNYQCSSAILKSFIPVFVYAYAFMILALPAMDVMICSVIVDRVPQFLRRNLAGVMWPSVSPDLDKPLIRVDRVISTLMRHLAVLLTFGFAYPLLGVGVVIAMVQYVWKWRLLIVRYVSTISIVSRAGSPGTVSGGDAPPVSDAAIREGADVNALMSKLNSDCKGTWRGAYICLWAVIWPGALFIGCLVFDILGDEVGWKDAIWSLGLVCTCPIVAWALIKIGRLVSILPVRSVDVFDSTISPIVEVELGEKKMSSA